MLAAVKKQIMVSLCALLLLASFASANTLIGADVEGCLNRASSGGCTPFITGTWNNSSATIIDPGVEFSGSYFDMSAAADFFADSLVFSLVADPLSTGSNPAPREVSFRFANGPLIVGFSQTGGVLATSSTSFTTNSITFNFGDISVLSANNPSLATFRIDTQQVPEPLSAGLLSLGLLSMGRLRQKRSS
jgi:hypothetical protein